MTSGYIVEGIVVLTCQFQNDQRPLVYTLYYACSALNKKSDRVFRILIIYIYIYIFTCTEIDKASCFEHHVKTREDTLIIC